MAELPVTLSLHDALPIFAHLKDSMITKGVASVRSPVCNLQQYDTNITHEAFTAAVVDEFQKEYGVNEQVSLYINIRTYISRTGYSSASHVLSTTQVT